MSLTRYAVGCAFVFALCSTASAETLPPVISNAVAALDSTSLILFKATGERPQLSKQVLTNAIELGVQAQKRLLELRAVLEPDLAEKKTWRAYGGLRRHPSYTRALQVAGWIEEAAAQQGAVVARLRVLRDDYQPGNRVQRMLLLRVSAAQDNLIATFCERFPAIYPDC